MNRLLKGIAIYLVVAVLLSLMAVSTIHSKILINGELLGHEFLTQNELKVFYDVIGDYIDIRQNLQEMSYEKLMDTDLDTINDILDDENNKIVAVYDKAGNWSEYSDRSVDLTQAQQRYRREHNVASALILPPLEVGRYHVFPIKTVDQEEVMLAMEMLDDSGDIISKYSNMTYRIQWIAIGLALSVSFLPILINMFFNYYLPLRRLQNATELIAEGEFDFNIESHGLDEIKSLSKALEHMRHELEEGRQREAVILENRKQLITNISHDLRTPITSIRGYVEGLLDGKGSNPERMDRYLRTIHDKTAYLNNMIEDLFMFSQLDLGEYKIEMRRWQASEVLNILFEPIELWVEDSGWSFEAETPYHSGFIEIDQMRLSQVIENIVQNSLKYGPENGKITVKTTVENHYYNITIGDNGEGIEKAALPYVLEAFYREDGSRQQSMGGSGLGLAICKKLVELHGGRIHIDSEIGIGTFIILSFPLKY